MDSCAAWAVGSPGSRNAPALSCRRWPHPMARGWAARRRLETRTVGNASRSGRLRGLGNRVSRNTSRDAQVPSGRRWPHHIAHGLAAQRRLESQNVGNASRREQLRALNDQISSFHQETRSSRAKLKLSRLATALWSRLCFAVRSRMYHRHHTLPCTGGWYPGISW